jgi:SAM-dependent methyltransferase
VPFDATGKISLEGIYTQPDPRGYFTTLRALDYDVPQSAAPIFRALTAQYRRAHGVPVPTVLDIGCSYGVNAALYRGATMDGLYARYGGWTGTRAALLERDRDLVRTGARDARWVGLDVSGPALAYATEAGFLDDAVHADLEADEPTPRQRAVLAGADLVVSTGCLGYVTERTLARVIGTARDRLPWMAHFVLRMFPFDPIAERLAALGYDTVPVGGAFPQRRFASAREQQQILRTMAEAGVDPRGLEAEGRLYARLYVSTPAPNAISPQDALTEKAAR